MASEHGESAKFHLAYFYDDEFLHGYKKYIHYTRLILFMGSDKSHRYDLFEKNTLKQSNILNTEKLKFRKNPALNHCQIFHHRNRRLEFEGFLPLVSDKSTPCSRSNIILEL